MPDYPVCATYRLEGVKGLPKAGGTARRITTCKPSGE
jgi:hypothetical protein